MIFFQDYIGDYLELPKEDRKAVVEQLMDLGVPREAVEELKMMEMPSLKELFEMEDKDEMNEKIFDMLITDTKEAAVSFSDLFEFDSLKEKKKTVEEIIEMVDKDPNAVTSAFSDLIFEKIEQQRKKLPTEIPKTTLGLQIINEAIPTTSTTTTTVKELSRARDENRSTETVKPTTTTVAGKSPVTTTETIFLKSDYDFMKGHEKDLKADILLRTGEEVRTRGNGKPTDPTVTLNSPNQSKQSVPLKTDIPFLNGHDMELKDEQLFTPRLPHPYKDPPAAAEGKLLRYWKNDSKSRELPKTPPNLDLEEDFDLPHTVLSDMQGLIEEGELSKEDVIEHLINNGFLPVEVTELGRIPITVGIPRGGGGEAASMRTKPPREDERRELLRRPENLKREQVTRQRLRELSTTQRMPFDEQRRPTSFPRFEDVDISDPDFDFERISPTSFRFGGEKIPRTSERPVVLKHDTREKTSTTNLAPEPTTQSTLKELDQVNVVMDMIRMFDEGQIDEDQLLLMLGERGDDVVAGKEGTRSENRKPRTQLESQRSKETTTEFSQFNMNLRPVNENFMKINMGGRGQEADEGIRSKNKEPRTRVESPRSKETTTEFTQFNTNLRPVNENFMKINMGGRVQEANMNIEKFKSSVIETDNPIITFPDEGLEALAGLEPETGLNPFSPPSDRPMPPSDLDIPMTPFTAFGDPVIDNPHNFNQGTRGSEGLFYHDIVKHHPAGRPDKDHHRDAPITHNKSPELEASHIVHPEALIPILQEQNLEGTLGRGEYGSREFPDFTRFHVESSYPEAVSPSYPPPPPLPSHEYHSQSHRYYAQSKDPPKPYTYLPPSQPYPSTHPQAIEFGARETYSDPSPHGRPFPPPHHPTPQRTHAYHDLQEPSPQPEVSSLSEHPYGPYGERYANYSPFSPAQAPSEPYWPEKQDALSPLYAMHAPSLPPALPPYNQEEHFNPQSSAFYPRSGLQYGQRTRDGRTIPFLPDHTTLKPFAYEAYPTIPRTGHGTLDHTIQDIHQAFNKGDVIGYRVVKTSKK